MNTGQRGQPYPNDDPTLEDDFGIALIGDQVARMALQVTTPFTLAVTGKWGSGKTSILRRAFVTLKGKSGAQDAPLTGVIFGEGEEDLDTWAFDSAKRDPPIDLEREQEASANRSLCVWYSAWQYQSSDNPLVALLLEIQDQFKLRVRLARKLDDINRRGGLAGLALLEKVIDGAMSLSIGKPVKQIQGTAEAIRKAWNEAAPADPELSDSQRFRLRFEDAVDTLLNGLPGRGENDSGRLLIFIDDLDRCEEGAVVQLLECVKLYIGTRRCVFVMALDDGALMGSLKRYWPERPDDVNREYLEKLFQATMPVPIPQKDPVKIYIEHQFNLHGMPGPGRCAEMARDIIEPNPRKIKNTVNSICAGWAVLGVSGVARHTLPENATTLALQLILFHYLRTHHRSIWRLLERQPWCLRVLTLVLNGNADQFLELPTYIDSTYQRLLKALFDRAFAHVLDDEEGGLGSHRKIPIGEAVDMLEERIDRKRSDEAFIRHYVNLIDINMDLPKYFLYIDNVGSNE